MPKLNHIHDWEHLGGTSFGMYRCRVCFCFGYREHRRFMTHPTTTRCSVIPYRCSVCGARAVGKDTVGKRSRYKQWRCHNHRGGRNDSQMCNDVGTIEGV